MEFISSILNYIVDLGSYIFVPILMAIIGFAFGLPFSRAIKSGVTVGIGLIGVSLVSTLTAESLSPVIEIFVERFDLSLTAIDVGGGPAAAVGFGNTLSPILILVVIAVNLLLVSLKLTNTVNVDIYNFWYYGITTGFVYLTTDNAVLAILAGVTHAVLGYVIADLNQKNTEEVIGIPGASIPHGFAAASAPLFMLLDKIYDMIPFFNHVEEDEDADLEEDNNRFLSGIGNILGDPLYLGLIMGALFGIFAQYDIQGIMDVSIKTGAILTLFPAMVKYIVSGLVPISQQAQKFFAERFSGRKLYIGLDSAVTIGHPLTQSVGVIMIPLFMIAAAILPGNTTLPLGEVPFAAFYICFATIVHKANKKRTLVSGIIFIPLVLYISSWAAVLFDQMAQNAGLTIVGAGQQATTMALGNLFIYLPTQLAQIPVWWIAALIMIAIMVVALLINRHYLKKRGQI